MLLYASSKRCWWRQSSFRRRYFLCQLDNLSRDPCPRRRTADSVAQHSLRTRVQGISICRPDLHQCRRHIRRSWRRTDQGFRTSATFSVEQTRKGIEAVDAILVVDQKRAHSGFVGDLSSPHRYRRRRPRLLPGTSGTGCRHLCRRGIAVAREKRAILRSQPAASAARRPIQRDHHGFRRAESVFRILRSACRRHQRKFLACKK